MDYYARLISDLVNELFGVDTAVQLTRPDAKFGDYSTNIAMQMAGQIGQNPRDIAEKLATNLEQAGEFSEVNIAGPGFINLRIAADDLAAKLDTEWRADYGQNNDGEGKTAVVEYPSPNMAKPYSVGHLRPGNQGWAAKRLMEATGWKVITDNHLGDYGAPFGIWVVGFLKFSSEEALERDGVYELGRVYIETKKALKDEKDRGEHIMADQVQDWLLRLESGDEEAQRYSQRFNNISLEHIHKIMGRLKIDTDYELGEAFFAPRGKEIVEQLLDKNIAVRNSDGSVIIPLDEYGIDTPLLILKSNGTALYATTDLATIFYREEHWHPDRVIYAVAAEQQFYFKQLFAAARKIGIETELIHMWFGLIDQMDENGVRAKMSSRRGVVLMEELLDMAEAKARQLVGGRDISDEDISKVALGAIKFSDFTSDRRTNILFDWDSIFALSGFCGPFVQYAAVRVNKILKDNEAWNMVTGDYDYQPEKSLLLTMLDYPEVIRSAARDLEPHKIATYLYELARQLNRYYEATRVDGTEPAVKSARLQTLNRVSYILNHGLNILGIEVPSKM